MTEREALTIVASLCADGVLDEKEEAILRKALAHPEHKKCENCGEFGECCQEQPERSDDRERSDREQEPFVIKHYSADERPTIKGNGFDGLEIGTDREDADEFIKWVNARICTPQKSQTFPQRTWVSLTDNEIDQGLLRTNYAMQTAGAWRDGVEWAQAQLKEKNT